MLVEAQASRFSLMNTGNDVSTSYTALSSVTLFSVFVCIPFVAGISQLEKTSLLLSSYIFTKTQQRVFQQAVAFTTPIRSIKQAYCVAFTPLIKEALQLYNYVALVSRMLEMGRLRYFREDPKRWLSIKPPYAI